jgi:putative transposase
MELRRSAHAVYELKYHLVWTPKYRAKILGGEVSQYLKEVFERISAEYGFRIIRTGIMEDHVHLLIEVPPVYSPAEVVQIMKSISARELFKKFPRMKKIMWSGRIWNEGYFVRSIGDKLTADAIHKYI